MPHSDSSASNQAFHLLENWGYKFLAEVKGSYEIEGQMNKKDICHPDDYFLLEQNPLEKGPGL